MPGEPGTKEQTYGIGAVARLTGMTDHTIRVWERRYGAVVAQRAANGRRIYTASDVEKLNLLKRLTDSGVSIGRIAGESHEELRQRLESMTELAVTAVPARINVAVLGGFLPAKLKRHRGDLAPVDVVIADTSAERFAADIGQQPVDVLVYEAAILDAEAAQRISLFLSKSGASRAIFVYGFGRTEDEELLRASGVVLLRAPVEVDELVAAIIASYEAPQAVGRAKSATESPAADTDWATDAEVAPRRFTQEQLSTLANAATGIECECPQNLAQLVADLSAFEVYSAHCANRDEEDAALHRYLHKTTSEARALIEVALERVAAAENLTY
ncbi:MAG TPA: MerR family transcriptional regulator [Gammaproteobacteria bacterium]